MILLLTAGYGEGHNAAARGLHAAFSQLGAESEIVDAFALPGGWSYNWSRRAYIDLINSAPLVWAAAFRAIDRFPIVPLTMPMLARERRALRRVFEEKKPTAVISVYPAYGYFIDRIFDGKPPFKVHTVVTDSITVNSVWHKCSSDTFIVANRDTAQVMIEAGIDPAKIHTLGFPVPPRFANERIDRPAPGVNGPARVLFMINAGKDIAPAIAARILELKGVQLTVTVGRDEALRRRILDAAKGRPIEIHGWTNRMPELLMSHHLLIGKAGGAAVQETIAARTPMLITHVVPGQEEGNARLLVQNRCGEVCDLARTGRTAQIPKLLAETTARVFANGAAEWREWETNITRLSRPDAALRIAEFVLKS